MARKNFMITEHFSYNEMTRSTWAETRRVDNTPNSLQLAALENLCRTVLEPLRQKFGPIRINSGFRSPRVNEGVHGVGNSKHLYGEAADIRIPDLPTGRSDIRIQDLETGRSDIRIQDLELGRSDIRIQDLELGRAYYRFLTTLPDIDQLLFEHRRDGVQWIHVSSCLNPADNRHQYFPNYRV